MRFCIVLHILAIKLQCLQLTYPRTQRTTSVQGPVYWTVAALLHVQHGHSTISAHTAAVTATILLCGCSVPIIDLYVPVNSVCWSVDQRAPFALLRLHTAVI